MTAICMLQQEMCSTGRVAVSLGGRPSNERMPYALWLLNKCVYALWPFRLLGLLTCNHYYALGMQRNIDKIQSNLKELEAKLQHEREKSKTYNEDLKIAEKKCAFLPIKSQSCRTPHTTWLLCELSAHAGGLLQTCRCCNAFLSLQNHCKNSTARARVHFFAQQNSGRYLH